MTEPDPAAIEKRLDAGERLSVVDVTTLLKPYRPSLSRTTVHRWLVAGKIGYIETPGGQRMCDPKDVRKILDDFRHYRRGAASSDADA